VPTSRSRRSPRSVHDVHRLYEEAVQYPPTEIARIERAVRRAGGAPLRLREDFSGTALLAASWVSSRPDRTAAAVDLDPTVHAWARTHRLPELGRRAERLSLVNADVRDGPRGPFDAVVALNFSYQVFHAREDLRRYLANARAALAPGGVVILDVFGGWESQQVIVERRRLRGGVTYVWEHESFDPITHRMRCAIHFELASGRRIRGAFRYDWRLWTIPELSELFREAGFDEVEVLWDVAPARAERYVPRTSAENQPGWIAYVIGRRGARRGTGRPPRAP
jgi:SAM-dependent methyltransferase